MAKTAKLLETIDLVGATLAEASHYALEIEVIASAMETLKENPEMEISEALQYGLKEWDIEK